MGVELIRKLVGGKWKYAVASGIPEQAVTFQGDPVYTLVLADSGRIVSIDNPDPSILYIPTYADAAFMVGTAITIRQAGVGVLTVTPMAGVILHSRADAFDLAGQYAYASLINIATDVWELTGDTA